MKELFLMEKLKEEKMKKNLWIGLALVLVMPALLFTVSCAKKTVSSEPSVKPAPAPAPAPSPAPAPAPSVDYTDLDEETARNLFENEDINFDFDKSVITPFAEEVLKRKAMYMRKHADISVIIEGHCDERGTAEYNLALGDRRAEAAKAFMVYLGIAGSRMTSISYGEERPVDSRSNEEAWAKNRRAQFRIQ